MASAADICPHCGQVADAKQHDVGDGLLACARCGALFQSGTFQRSHRDTINAKTSRKDRKPSAATSQRRSDPHVAATQLASHRGTLAWTFGILLLLFALAGQFTYFMRDDLARHTPLRPVLTLMCQYAGCEIPLLHAPEYIRMKAREIRRHPDAPEALRISITFSNEAAFTQAYP
ncbi:MAG: DUF3426 domain-containing protein, partial [Chromatiales bacterium]|nr:DUF3426 domain-containing protein [Chromatiales bacterium]